MSRELEDIRAFRAAASHVDAASQAAAREKLLAYIAASSHVPHRQRPSSSRSSMRRAAAIAPSAAAVLASLAVVIGVAAVIASTGAQRTPPAARAEHPNAGTRARLISLLGVLRRAQTAAEQNAHLIYPYNVPWWPTHQRRIDRPLVRLATTTPWGAKVFVIPVLPSRDPVAARALGETVMLYVPGWDWGFPATIENLKNGGGWLVPRTFQLAGGKRVTRFLTLVPDGVTKVVYDQFPLPRNRWIRGHPIRLTQSITATVHNNIAVVQTSIRNPDIGFDILYAADGHVISRGIDWRYLRRVHGHWIENF